MSDVMTSPTPNTQPIDVWRFPTMGESQDSAARTAAEYQQHQYADFLATPDRESSAVEAGLPITPIREGGAHIDGAVNEYETVPPADELTAYTNRVGETVDPQHAEAVLGATAEALAHATSRNEVPTPGYSSNTVTTPHISAAAPVNEVVVTPQERLRNHNAAVSQAAVYAGGIEAMRNSVLSKWGAEAAEE